jgi:hypothetical protein
MDAIYKNFYRSFYLKTGGFIPTSPINQNVFPGDFFQIKNGEMIVLGNIFRNTIIDKENIEFGYAIQLNEANWGFSDGVTKPYSGRGIGHGAIGGEFEFSKQILAFDYKGSFIFKSQDPEAIKILNWNDIQQQLIIKLTQTFYSFREVYVVTECATTSSATLAIAGNENAELEIASDSENFGLVDLFGNHATKTIQSKDIEYYHRENKRNPSYFKAKKLVVQDEKQNYLISNHISNNQNKSEWANNFFEYDFSTIESDNTLHTNQNLQIDVLDMLQANELNPNTALLYFKWSDTNLDDIEKLFLSYSI